MKRALGWLVVSVAVCPAPVAARPKKVALIDEYCAQIRDEFRDTVPVAFSGPDPWVEIDDIGATLSDGALAYVYAEGPAIRWVVLIISGPRQSWTQTTDYYFRNDGSIAKRDRSLRSITANIQLEEATYYVQGRAFKDFTHHRALGPGHQDSSKLDDPDAPTYLTVDELPFPETPDYLRQVAALSECLIDIPNQIFHIFKPD
jgi:hypothetical protein